MFDFEVGSKVRVIDQDISGTVLAIHADTNEVVIADDGSEYGEHDNQLVFRPSDLAKGENNG